jgi:DNA-binding transcriptional MocR family regulator
MDRSWSEKRLTRVLSDWAVGTAPDGAMFRMLADRLRELIHAGDIPAGVRLPSERAIASVLGVSRTTVVTALDILRSEGLLVSRQGAGTHVSMAGVHREARGDSRLFTFVGSPEAHAPPPGGIDLRSAALPGLPLVVDAIAGLDAQDLTDLVASHGYVPGGLPELRQAISTYFDDLGLATAPEQILVTSGAQQALRLVSTVLLEPGGLVVVEEPTFRGAIETLRAAGARLVPVPSGSDGMDLDALHDVVGRVKPALIFVQTTGNNPTGAVMPESGRARLARIASASGTPVVEDAAVCDALIDGEQASPLAHYGADVVTIGSASKSFWGGLRVGWLRADPNLIHHLAVVKGAEDLGTSLVAQVLTARLLPRVDVARKERRHILGEARSVLLRSLAERLPEWTPCRPHAGGSLWVRIPRPGATGFAQQAERRGVSVLPGPTFSCRDALDDHLRISFAATTESIVQGVERLAETWHDKHP